jgi:hypothetical protein
MAAPGAPAFGGTFLQLTPRYAAFTAQEWRGVVDLLESYSIRRLILQWTMPPAVPLEPLFDLAAARGIRIELGLIEDPAFWRDPISTLSRLRKPTEDLIRRHRALAGHAAFGGWYITQEIDDTRWRDDKTRRALSDYLKRVVRRCQKTRRATVTVSAFANGVQPPEQFAAFLAKLRHDVKIDRILFQDSIGARKLTPEQLPAYYRALQGIATPVVEIFEMTREDPFEARTAPIDRIRRQLDLVREAGYEAPVVFSVPEYHSDGLQATFGRR